jgi:hypothetical protein
MTQNDRQKRPRSEIVDELPASNSSQLREVEPENNFDPALNTQYELLHTTVPDAFQPADEDLRRNFSHDHTSNEISSPSGVALSAKEHVNPRHGISRSHIVSNPLGLVADASDAAQQLELQSEDAATSPQSQSNRSTGQTGQSVNNLLLVGRRILRRPGYISLGLTLDSKTLENGLDHLFAPQHFASYENLNYFKQPSTPPKLDTGPDLDPVDLGLLTMDEASSLFPM